MGGPSGNVGRDFDFFGNTAQVSDAIGEEQVRYHYQPPDQSTQRPKKTGYEKYQDPGYIPDIQAKSSAWKSQARPSGQEPELEPSTSTASAAASRRMMTLEEVEAQMRGPGPSSQQQQQQHPFPTQRGPPPPQQPPQQFQPVQPPVQHMPTGPSPQPSHQRMPSQPSQPRGPQQPLQILQNPNRPRHSPQPSADLGQLGGIPVITHPQQLMDLSEEQRRAYLEEDAKRAKRNHKIFLLSKGNGLMTPQDKNFITRIQLQQLVTATSNSADPSPEASLAEDFYYQVYSQIRGAPRQHPGQPLGHFAQTYLFQTGGRAGNRRHNLNGDNHMQRMQQQVQRAVEAAKLKPKNKQLIIEGSLGKISFSNAKTPKPLLNIKRHENPDSRPGTGKKGAQSPSDRKTILRNIESVYSVLMRLEDHERKQPPAPQEGNADAVQAHIEWRQELSRLNTTLWQDLKVLDRIDRTSPQLHPFIALLTFAKGKKVIPRVFRLIDQEQRVTILTMIVVHLDQLDVVRNGKIPAGDSQPPASVREDIELFSQAVMPSLLAYVSEAPMNIISGLLALAVGHTAISNVVVTKVGLGILTMLLSRAELVKESGGVSDADTQHWTETYNRFFDSLEQLLGEIFPGPVNGGDDMYIWQFLAAVGIGASPEQQQRLVIGVKERVIETVKYARGVMGKTGGEGEKRLGNVNLFMRAIGLDVEMLG